MTNEEKKEYKFDVEIGKHDGTVIEWISDEKKIEDFTPVLNCFTCYDEGKQDDILLYPVSNDLEFVMRDLEGRQYEIMVFGTVTIPLDRAEMDVLEAADFKVELAIDLRDAEGNCLDEGDGYDYIYGQATYLELLEE